MTPSSESINLLEQLTELRETQTFNSLLKDIDEQPDKERHKVRSGRVLRTGSSVPLELGCVPLLVLGSVHQPRSSLNSVL